MEDKANILRRQIDAYRCHLSVSTDIRIFRLFQSAIFEAEAELAALEAERGARKKADRPKAIGTRDD